MFHKIETLTPEPQVSVLVNSLLSITVIFYTVIATTTFFTFYRSEEITILEGKIYDPHANLSYGDISVDNSQDPNVIYVPYDQTIKNLPS